MCVMCPNKKKNNELKSIYTFLYYTDTNVLYCHTIGHTVCINFICAWCYSSFLVIIIVDDSSCTTQIYVQSEALYNAGIFFYILLTFHRLAKNKSLNRRYFSRIGNRNGNSIYRLHFFSLRSTKMKSIPALNFKCNIRKWKENHMDTRLEFIVTLQ